MRKQLFPPPVHRSPRPPPDFVTTMQETFFGNWIYGEYPLERFTSEMLMEAIEAEEGKANGDPKKVEYLRWLLSKTKPKKTVSQCVSTDLAKEKAEGGVSAEGDGLSVNPT